MLVDGRLLWLGTFAPLGDLVPALRGHEPHVQGGLAALLWATVAAALLLCGKPAQWGRKVRMLWALVVLGHVSCATRPLELPHDRTACAMRLWVLNAGAPPFAGCGCKQSRSSTRWQNIHRWHLPWGRQKPRCVRPRSPSGTRRSRTRLWLIAVDSSTPRLAHHLQGPQSDHGVASPREEIEVEGLVE